MNRRTFFKAFATAPALGLLGPPDVAADMPKAKITRVRIYRPPNLNQLFNQSNMVVTVETDIGITGVGEGGAKDTLEQCAGSLIGQNPFRIEAIWQEAYIAWFYPPGREKTHALGALDLALWDIKGKALKAAGARDPGRHRARLLRVLRDRRRAPGRRGARRAAEPERARPRDDGSGLSGLPDGRRRRRRSAGSTTRASVVRRVAQDCKDVREAVGPDGNWCIDLHQRFDLNDALRVCKVMEEYDPFFVEDPVRDEHALQDIPKLRQMTTVPLTHGEEWGLQVGLQPARREPRHRLHPLDAARTSAASPR